MVDRTAGPEFNSKGYLTDFSAWNRELALELAQAHDLELTACHWQVIDFLRDYYRKFELAPDPRVVVKELSQAISPNAPCTRKHLDGLFGKDGCRLACRIAGLPDCHCRM